MHEEEDDIHVDWHMTPDEWQELKSVLLQHKDVTYIKALIDAGKI
jgi:hypothetical protein